MEKKATLKILDQVNVKFEGLDAHVRRRVCDALKFYVPYARHMPSFKLGRWDGKVSFATVGGATYINLLDRALPIILDEGYELDVVDQRPDFVFEPPTITEDFLSDHVWPHGHPAAGKPIMLRDYQVEAAQRYFDNPQSMQCISTGAGKAQPLWSNIKTPSGWITMAEAALGTIVSTPDGGNAPITGVFPQGKKPIYMLTFKDGRTAEACEDHLWNVYCVDWGKTEDTRWRTITTKQLIAHMKSKKRPLRVQLPKPETKAPAVLDIDPYVLGALIGDGGLHNGTIMFSTADSFILNKVQERLTDGYEFCYVGRYDYRLRLQPELRAEERAARGNNRVGHSMNKYVDIIRDLGLNVLSNEKFIPAMYLEKANFDQKIDLIQGLIDTDGHVGRHGDITFTTVSRQLAEQFEYLIRSIGGQAKTKSRKTTFTYKGKKKTGQQSYTVRVRYHDPKSLVSVPRKKSRIRDDYQYSESLKLQIMTVEYIGEHLAQCIMVGHPDHLYITDNFVVTHNTILSATLSKVVEPHGRSVCIVPSKTLVEQTEEDYQNLGLDVGVFFGDRKEWDHKHTICTWQSLSVFSKKSKNEEAPVPISEFLKDVKCVIVDECFDGDTLVLTPDGSKPIKDFVPGDVVLNFDERHGGFKKDTVVKLHKNLAVSSDEDMLAITLDNESVLRVTANHRFLTHSGWIRADELIDDDVIEPGLRMVDRTVISKPEAVYNLHIEHDHNYVVGGAVVANCHSAKADELRELLSGPFADVPLRWGMTGTIPKEDFEYLTLLSTIGPVVGEIRAAKLQDEGVLANCAVEVVQLIDNHVEFKDYHEENDFLTSDKDRLAWIADYITKVTETGNTLILVDRIECGNMLKDAIPGSVFVNGTMKTKNRKKEYKEVQFSNDKIIIATYGVAAVGINIPRIFNLILLEPGKSFVRVIQSIGRGIRKAEDKDFVRIIDLCSTLKFSSRHLTKRKQYYKEADYPFTITKTKYR